MKNLSEKGTATVISIIMVILLITGYFLQYKYPDLSTICMRTSIWYAAIIVGLYIVYYGLKFMTWLDMHEESFIDWLLKKRK